MLKQVEEALESHVRAILGRADLKSAVRPFPENIRELKTPTPSGQVLISYKRSSFNLIEKDVPIRQEQTLFFDLVIQIKGLRTHTGAYALLDELRFGLMGWMSGLSAQNLPAYTSDERFLDLDENLWAWSQTIAIPLIIEQGVRPEFVGMTDQTDWESLDEIRVAVGLWRSRAGALGDKPTSTKDAVVKTIVEEA
jgi:hypothetical protein